MTFGYTGKRFTISSKKKKCYSNKSNQLKHLKWLCTVSSGAGQSATLKSTKPFDTKQYHVEIMRKNELYRLSDPDLNVIINQMEWMINHLR